LTRAPAKTGDVDVRIQFAPAVGLASLLRVQKGAPPVVGTKHLVRLGST